MTWEVVLDELGARSHRTTNIATKGQPLKKAGKQLKWEVVIGDLGARSHRTTNVATKYQPLTKKGEEKLT